MKTLAIIFTVSIFGCSTSSGSVKEKCSLNSGVYSYTFVRTSGNCVEVPSQEIIISPNKEKDNSCRTTASSISEDHCKVAVQQICQLPSGGGATTLTEGIVADDDRSISGSISVSRTDSMGNLICVGTYQFQATLK